jgi:hypothetical protein
MPELSRVKQPSDDQEDRPAFFALLARLVRRGDTERAS